VTLAAEEDERDDVDDLFDDARARAGLPKLVKERKGKACGSVMNLHVYFDLMRISLWLDDSLTTNQRKAAVQETPEQKLKREKKESEEAAILDQGKILWEACEWSKCPASHHLPDPRCTDKGL
jgi:hypothetical protein